MIILGANMAIEGIQDLWHAVKGDLDVKSKNLLKEATGHKVDNIVDLAEFVSTVGSAKAASKTSSKAFTEASSKLRRELNKARKVETAVSEKARLTSKAARQFIRRECGAFRGPKRFAKPVDFKRLFKKHGVKTAPGPGLQPLSEAELEKVVGGAKDPSWRPGGTPKAPGLKSDSQMVAKKPGTIWSRIRGTAEKMPGTEIPATFQIDLAEDIKYINPKTGTNTLWTNANATEHMQEFLKRFGGETSSTGIRSQLMLESYESSLNEAMKKVPPNIAEYEIVSGGWQLGINMATGVVYHARML